MKCQLIIMSVDQNLRTITVKLLEFVWSLMQVIKQW